MDDAVEFENGSLARFGRLRRGGANCRGDRVSWQLTADQCYALRDAVWYAFECGRVFNRFITIGWGVCGLDPSHSVVATGRWIALFRDWLRKSGHPHAWAWVQEHGPVMGAHAHVLLHVPSELDWVFRQRPKEWMGRVLRHYDLAYCRRAVQSQRIRPDYSRIDWSASLGGEAGGLVPESDWAGYHGVYPKMHYMLKCAPAYLEEELAMVGVGPRPWGNRCRVLGKRLAVWQSHDGG